MSNPDAQNQDAAPERSVVDQVQEIYASRFGALTRRDGAVEYARWAVADKVRPHVFAAAMDKLAKDWGDRYGKPKLPDVRKAYWDRVRLLQDSRAADSKPCSRCYNDGFVWCTMGRDQWSNVMHPINRKQPEWYPALGVFVQPCDCHAGKIRNAKSFHYSDVTLHELNRDCAFAVTGGYAPNGEYLAAPAGATWKAERDSSIMTSRRNYNAVEFVSPVLSGAEGVANTVAFIEWIKAIGGRINASCGLHIHVGIRSVIGQNATDLAMVEFVKKAVSICSINRTALYAQTGTRDRETGRWAQPVNLNTREGMWGARDAARRGDLNGARCFLVGHDTRYRMINTHNAYNAKGTIEFRLFAGTLNTDKVLHHLWSALFVCGFANDLKAVRWTGKENWESGEKALRNFWKKAREQGMFGLILERRKEIKAEALRLARKYDEAAPAATATA